MSSRHVLVPSDDQYLFNLKAGNNEKILTSERYTTRASALRGIEASAHQCGARRALRAQDRQE